MDQSQSNHSIRGGGRGGILSGVKALGGGFTGWGSGSISDGESSRGGYRGRMSRGSPMSRDGQGSRGGREHHGDAPIAVLTKPQDPRKNANGSLKLGLEIVMVLVGNSTIPTPVYRELIAASSEFCANVLKGNFIERDGTWLYSEHFDAEPKPALWSQLLRLNVLGNYLQDRCFRNATVDAVFNNASHDYPSILAAPAFKQLLESSPFRRLLIEFRVFQQNIGWFTSTCAGNDDSDTKIALAEILVEVAKGFFLPDSPTDMTLWFTGRCQYHEHVDGEGKCT
ncbi:hypothetical protein E2P81_ATG00735 [Venturia nashicola]|nr:hypothetical protein E2P81_ATG00735 [Venturia nashicola]